MSDSHRRSSFRRTKVCVSVLLEAKALSLWRLRAKASRLGHLGLPSDSARDASASQAEACPERSRRGREFGSRLPLQIQISNHIGRSSTEADGLRRRCSLLCSETIRQRTSERSRPGRGANLNSTSVHLDMLAHLYYNPTLWRVGIAYRSICLCNTGSFCKTRLHATLRKWAGGRALEGGEPWRNPRMARRNQVTA